MLMTLLAAGLITVQPVKHHVLCRGGHNHPAHCDFGSADVPCLLIACGTQAPVLEVDIAGCLEEGMALFSGPPIKWQQYPSGFT